MNVYVTHNKQDIVKRQRLGLPMIYRIEDSDTQPTMDGILGEETQNNERRFPDYDSMMGYLIYFAGSDFELEEKGSGPVNEDTNPDMLERFTQDVVGYIKSGQISKMISDIAVSMLVLGVIPDDWFQYLYKKHPRYFSRIQTDLDNIETEYNRLVAENSEILYEILRYLYDDETLSKIDLSKINAKKIDDVLSEISGFEPDTTDEQEIQHIKQYLELWLRENNAINLSEKAPSEKIMENIKKFGRNHVDNDVFGVIYKFENKKLPNKRVFENKNKTNLDTLQKLNTLQKISESTNIKQNICSKIKNLCYAGIILRSNSPVCAVQIGESLHVFSGEYRQYHRVFEAKNLPKKQRRVVESTEWVAELYELVDGELEIFEPTTDIPNDAFKNQRITFVKFPKTLLSIGNRCFMDNMIKKITFPDGLESIGSDAFNSNEIESSVVLPSSVVYIGSGAFKDNWIPKVEISKNLQSIEQCVFEGNAIESVIIPQGVISIDEDAFACNKISELRLPQSLRTLGAGAFRDNRLEKVKLPSELQNIGISAFSDNNIADVTISSKTEFYNATFDDSTVVNIQDSSPVNEWLEESTDKYDFNDGHLQIHDGVTEITESEFFDQDIISVEFPETLKRIGKNAFLNNKITQVDLPDGLEFIGYAAFANNNIEKVILPDSVKQLGDLAFSGNDIESIVLSKGLTKIRDGAFSKNKLTEVVIPENIALVEFEAFSKNNIKNVSIPKTTKVDPEAFDPGVEINKTSINESLEIESILPKMTCEETLKYETMLDQAFENPNDVYFAKGLKDYEEYLLEKYSKKVAENRDLTNLSDELFSVMSPSESEIYTTYMERYLEYPDNTEYLNDLKGFEQYTMKKYGIKRSQHTASVVNENLATALTPEQWNTHNDLLSKWLKNRDDKKLLKKIENFQEKISKKTQPVNEQKIPIDSLQDVNIGDEVMFHNIQDEKDYYGTVTDISHNNIYIQFKENPFVDGGDVLAFNLWDTVCNIEYLQLIIENQE